MILVILLWILVFFIFVSFGFSVIQLTGRLSKERSATSGVVESFFMGFLILSVLAGYLSIWIPVGNTVLLVTGLLSVLLFILNYRGIISQMKESVSALKSLSWIEIIILFLIIVYVLASVAYRITWGDTESYHVQAIEWIRQYPVVPGTG